jgi:UDP-N-acetylmuramate dehydrogenase
MDVRARYWAEYGSADELKELLSQYADVEKCFIGQGSNLLFTKDYEGIVLHSSMARAKAVRETSDEVYIEAQSGLVMDDLIAQLCDMNLYGMENLSHIPGEVGASAVQNVGAYGVEAKDVISQVEVLETATGEIHTLNNQDCKFGYRDSVFKGEQAGKYVVLNVTFRLSKKAVYKLDYGQLRDVLPAAPSASAIRNAVIAIRQSKLPEVGQTGSAGSFFKNPIVDKATYEHLRTKYASMPSYTQADGYKIPAAWLIEQAGGKSLSMGGAAVYEKQPLVIINRHNATPEDVMALAKMIQDRVEEQFGINLQREVIYI